MRKAIIFTAVLLLLSVLILPAYADTVDLNRKGSITASMVHDGQPVPGGTLTLYRVADLNLSGGDLFRYVEEYSACEVKLEDLGPKTASEVAAYTYYRNIQGLTKTIDDAGCVKFEELTPGLFLLIQWDAAPGYTTVMPFLVCIPSSDNGEYIYDITSVPKQEPSTEPTEPSEPTEPTTTPPETTEPTEPPTEPTEPSLPQTGQNHWPVPVLFVGGVFLVILGAVLMRRDGKHHDA